MVHQRKSDGDSAEFLSLLRTASDPATNSDQLARLQRHRSRKIRQAVAGNPNLDVPSGCRLSAGLFSTKPSEGDR